MKILLILPLILLFSTISIAQKKEIKNAITLNSKNLYVDVFFDKNEKINKQHKKSNQNKCYESIKEYDTNFNCGGKKQQSYEVICGNGNKKYYYYVPLSIGACSEGYYDWITLDIDRYLGKYKDKALKKLCDCKN